MNLLRSFVLLILFVGRIFAFARPPLIYGEKRWQHAIQQHSGKQQQKHDRNHRYCSELRGGDDDTIMSESRNIEFYTLKNGMCPYAARTLIVLLELGYPFDTIEVSGQPKPDWYLNINPRGKVPAIRVPNDGNVIVYESAICNEYLCEYYDTTITGEEEDNNNNSRNSLLPRDAPSVRAKIRLLNDHYDTVVGPAQFTFLMNKDPAKDEELQAAMEGSLDVYEETLKNNQESHPYFMGEAFTLADIHVLPFFLRLVVSLRHFKGYELPPERYPKLLRWFDICSKRKSVLQAAKSEEEIIDVYKMFVERDYAFGGLNKN